MQFSSLTMFTIGAQSTFFSICCLQNKTVLNKQINIKKEILNVLFKEKEPHQMTENK